jgi:S1-C subfamily serine protease
MRFLPEVAMIAYPAHLSPASPRGIALAALLLFMGFALLHPAAARAAAAETEAAAPEKAPAAEPATESVDANRLFAAIVKVQTRAVPNARSAATLGQERDGSGIVIGEGGLILTIGYLIVEADDVKVVDSRGRTLPAKIVGYDHATGLGLIRAVTSLGNRPVPLGDSARLAEHDPVMIVNSGGPDDVTLAYVVSLRPFTGSWEYMLDRAIFTSPPTLNWSGAALIDQQGKLIGIGSLIVRDAIGGERELPGNMFVPIDVLKPVLADLIKTGRRAGPARPWLGVAVDEQNGRLFVTRVSPESPADQAGIKAGDIILGVGGDGVRTQAEFYRKVWRRGAAGTDIPLRVLQGIDVKELQVRSIDRVDYFRPQTTF